MKIIINFESKSSNIDLNLFETFLELKNKIIKNILNKENIYINLKFISNNPIRIFGKYVINPGIISSNYDNEKLSKFSFKNNLIFEAIIVKAPTKKINKYIFTKNKKKEDFKLNLDEFPPL